MKLSIQAGATSQSINIFIQNAASASGAGLTGLVYNTSNLTAYYMLPKAAATAITLATLAAVTSSWSSGGFKEIDATNAPGWYRFDIPNAAIASGRFASFHFRGAASMVETPAEVELTAHDNQSLEHYGIVGVETAQSVPTTSTVTLQNGTKARIHDFIYTFSATTGTKQLHQVFSIDASVPTAKVATIDPAFDDAVTGTLVYWDWKGPRAPTTNLPTVLGSVGTGSGQWDLSGGKVSLVSADRAGIRKNVALAGFMFEMLDSITKSPVGGKTVTVARRLNNGSFGAGTLSAVTDLLDGGYSVDFAAADLNGDSVGFKATAPGCDTTLLTIITDP